MVALTSGFLTYPPQKFSRIFFPPQKGSGGPLGRGSNGCPPPPKKNKKPVFPKTIPPPCFFLPCTLCKACTITLGPPLFPPTPPVWILKILRVRLAAARLFFFSTLGSTTQKVPLPPKKFLSAPFYEAFSSFSLMVFFPHDKKVKDFQTGFAPPLPGVSFYPVSFPLLGDLPFPPPMMPISFQNQCPLD